MLNKIGTLVIAFFLLTVTAYSAGDSGGSSSEGKISKYDQGHKLVLSGKHWEKKADKFLKKGNTTKAEKNLAKAEKKYERAFKLFFEYNKDYGI